MASTCSEQMFDCCELTPMDPKYVAREIKAQHEQSGAIFPNDRTTGFDRYGSLYARDFNLEAIRPKGLCEVSDSRPARVGYHKRNNPHPSVMFMNWKLPSRLYQHDPSVFRKSQDGYDQLHNNAEITKLSKKLPPAYLVRKTHDPTTTTHFTPTPGTVRQMREREIEEFCLREAYAREKRNEIKKATEATHLPAMPLLSKRLNMKLTSDRPKDAGVIPPANNALTMSGKIRKEITQEDRDYINKAYNRKPESETAKIVTKWLETASPKDRELAVEFFTSMAGKKLLGSEQVGTGNASCNVCDGTRLKDVLTALQSGSPIARRGQKNLRPGESNRRRLRLLSPFTRSHKQEMQTWHHLPTIPNRGPISNTNALFTRPHHPVQRHFTIHPEWE